MSGGAGAMSLVLRNAQRAVPLRRVPLRRAVCVLRAALGASRFHLGLVCAGNGLMRRLNGEYRQCPEPTDVLSFPFHRLAAGELPRPRSRDEYNLGDIFLGVEFIQQQCRARGEDLDSVLVINSAFQNLSEECGHYLIFVVMHGEQRLFAASSDKRANDPVTAAHGLCHLLGYRHDTKPEWQQMYQKEVEILEELNRLTGTNLRPLTAGLF